MTRSLSLCLALLVAPLACSKNPPSPDAPPTVVGSETAAPSGPKTPGSARVDEKLLVGTWVHSYEEGAVYRRQSYKADWGPSHFRGSFTLLADGTATWDVLAPNDRHSGAKGTWKLDGDGNVVLTVVDGDHLLTPGTVRKLLVASVTSDKLELPKDAPSIHHAQ